MLLHYIDITIDMMSYTDGMDLSINMCLYVLPLLFITLLSCFTPHYKRHKECITNISIFNGDLKAKAINVK